MPRNVEVGESDGLKVLQIIETNNQRIKRFGSLLEQATMFNRHTLQFDQHSLHLSKRPPPPRHGEQHEGGRGGNLGAH